MVKIITIDELFINNEYKKYLLNWIVGAEGNFIEHTVDEICETKLDILLKGKYGCTSGEFLFIEV